MSTTLDQNLVPRTKPYTKHRACTCTQPRISVVTLSIVHNSTTTTRSFGSVFICCSDLGLKSGAPPKLLARSYSRCPSDFLYLFYKVRNSCHSVRCVWWWVFPNSKMLFSATKLWSTGTSRQNWRRGITWMPRALYDQTMSESMYNNSPWFDNHDDDEVKWCPKLVRCARQPEEKGQ